MTKQQTFTEKCYKNSEGKVVLAQAPNLPLLVWFPAMIMSKIVQTGTVHNLFDLVAFGAIFTWAWLELFQGDAYIRRAFGLVVLIIIITGRI